MKIKIKKPILLSLAEIVDAWRIVPRIFLFGYGYLLVYVILWFMELKSPNTQQTVLVSTITGMATIVFGFYTNTSKNWIAFNKEYTDRYIKLTNIRDYINLVKYRTRKESRISDFDRDDDILDFNEESEESNDEDYYKFKKSSSFTKDKPSVNPNLMD